MIVFMTVPSPAIDFAAPERYPRRTSPVNNDPRWTVQPMAGPVVWTPSRDYSERTQRLAVHAAARHRRLEELRPPRDGRARMVLGRRRRRHAGRFLSPLRRRVLDTTRGLPWTRWFVGGTINLAHQCLDRHARSRAPRPDGRALAGGGRQRSASELRGAFAETNRLANSLKRLGIGRGDRVGLFLPMLPEAVVACWPARRSARSRSRSSRASAPAAVADGSKTARPSVLITADATLRRGELIPMKSIADEAVAASAERPPACWWSAGSVATSPWTPGRDVWWHEAGCGHRVVRMRGRADGRGRPVHDRLHLGDDGQAQGGDPRPWRVPGRRSRRRSSTRSTCGKTIVLCWVTDMGWIMGPWEVVGGLALGGTVVLVRGRARLSRPRPALAAGRGA